MTKKTFTHFMMIFFSIYFSWRMREILKGELLHSGWYILDIEWNMHCVIGEMEKGSKKEMRESTIRLQDTP